MYKSMIAHDIPLHVNMQPETSSVLKTIYIKLQEICKVVLGGNNKQLLDYVV